MLEMAWSKVVCMTLLIAYNSNLAAAIQKVKVNELCPNSPLQGAFNQIFSNRPFVRLGNGTESAAKVYQSWDEDELTKFQDCAFYVDSNLYVDGPNANDSQQIGRGLSMSIRKINFRYNPTTSECIDYVRFTFGGSKTDKICGTFDGESEIGQQSYFIDPSGIVKVHIFVDKSVPFDVAQINTDIELIFTAYERCSGENLIQCFSKDEGFCISETLKNDGIHNCLPPSNADEPNSPFPVFGREIEQREGQLQQQYLSQRMNSGEMKKSGLRNGNAPSIGPKNGLLYLVFFASSMFISNMS